MRKFTIVALLAIFSVPMFAQVASLVNDGKTVYVKSQNVQSANTLRGIQADVWTNTCSTIADWTVGNNNTPADASNWVQTTTGASNTGYCPLLVSTTAADGWLMFDSDGYGSGVTADAWIMNAVAIDCGMYSGIHLEFEQVFRQYSGSEQAFVGVSADGTTWTETEINMGLAGNASTPNPDLQDIDISAVADGATTVYIRFRYVGNWGYMWEVDDIRLYEYTPPADPDVAVTGLASVEYPIVPLSQVAANTYAFAAGVENIGAEITVATDVTLDIFAAAFSDAAAITVPMATGATEVVNFAGSFNPIAEGVYESIFNIDLAGDVDLTNNSDTLYLAVSDTIMAREDGSSSDGGLGFGAGYEGFFGQQFDIVTDGYEITSASMVINPVIGVTTRIDVYNDNAGMPGTVIGTTGDYTLVAADTLMGGYMTLAMQTPVAVAAGSRYYLIVHEETATDNIGLATTTAWYMPGTSWVSFDGAAWNNTETYNFLVAYILRANINLATSVDNNVAENNVVVYPNPTSGTLNIANAENAQVTIFNIVGEVVASIDNAQTFNTVDMSSFEAGNYVVKVVSGTEVSTTKITLVK